jgi:hypothetical protein
MSNLRLRCGVLAAAIVSLVGACTSAVPVIDRDTPGFSSLSEEELSGLAEGRSLYVSKCSGCHPLYPPSEGDAEFWEEHVEDMAGRARIDPGQSDLILRYLEAASSLKTP